MANRMKAIAAYRPRIDRIKTQSTDRLARYIEGRTTLNHGEVLNVLKELQQAVLYFTEDGQSIKIEGLGTFWPVMKLNGQIKIAVRLDSTLKRSINRTGAFTGCHLLSPEAFQIIKELFQIAARCHRQLR